MTATFNTSSNQTVPSSLTLNRTPNGQSLIELLITIALTSIFIPALLTAFLFSREGRSQQEQRLQAVALLQETQEALRSVRERNWTQFAVNGIFHSAVSGAQWTLTPGSQTISGFTRTIQISDVYRDSSGEIVSIGGTLDSSTKKVFTSVAWSLPYPSSVDTSAFFTRHHNLIYKETTESDFNAGTKSTVAVTNTQGGEIVLGAGGQGNWCEPNLSISGIDLPKQGVANAISAIVGQVVAGTGENASGVSLAEVSISNTKPPNGNISGTLDGYKTNDVFGEENYAYLATDNNFKEVVIIDLSQKDANNKFLETGYFNAPGNGSGNSVFAKDNIGYMTSGDKLYTFDLSSKSGSRSKLGEVALSAPANKLVVINNYAYVALETTDNQLQIIEVSNNGQNLTLVGQAHLNGRAGRGLYINSTGTKGYLVTAASDTQPEFFIVDLSTKTGDRPTLGTYNTNGMNPKGVTVVTGNKAIVVGNNGEEYQVINIDNETVPVRCGGLNVDSGVNGVSSVLESDGDAYSYIITGDSNSELKIIEGGPGGQFSLNGVFESRTFDASREAAFNRFEVTALKPPLTDIKYQIAVTDPINESCNDANFTFIGPDLSSGTFFATGSAVPFDNNGIDYENPGRCLRYRVYLSSSEPNQTPIFYEINLSYSP